MLEYAYSRVSTAKAKPINDFPQRSRKTAAAVSGGKKLLMTGQTGCTTRHRDSCCYRNSLLRRGRQNQHMFDVFAAKTDATAAVVVVVVRRETRTAVSFFHYFFWPWASYQTHTIVKHVQLFLLAQASYHSFTHPTATV